MRRATLICVLIISIFSLVLFTCPFAYAQSHKLSDECWNKAEELQKQGKYPDAAEMYEKFVEAEKASPSPRVEGFAPALISTGYCYYLIGQYDKAIKNYKKALAIAEKLGREDGISLCLNNIGMIYHSLGQYDKAIEHYEKFLDIARKHEQEVGISISLNNIGGVYKEWGQYDKAIENFKKALAIARKLGQEVDISTAFNNIGLVYDKWGQYDEAIENFKKALAIAENLEKEDYVATCLVNIGNVYNSWEQYNEGIENYKKALTILGKLGLKGNIALVLNNIGSAYISLDQYDNAIENFKKALAIAKENLGQQDMIGLSLNNIGMVYDSRGQHDKAIENFKKALAIAEELGQQDMEGVYHCNIGRVYYRQGKYKTAIEFLIDSISIKEKLRKTATGDIRRDYLASQLSTYQMLTSAYIRDSDFPSAYQTVELSRAKLLAERLAGDESKVRPPEVKQIQDTLDEDTVVLVYANVDLDDIVQIAITKEKITGKEVFNEVAGSDIDNIINYYRFLIESPSAHYQRGVGGIIEDSKGSQSGNTEEIGKGLYKLLIKPMEGQLKGKKNIIIVPDGILAFVPFETLIDEEGKYLVEDYYINYVQSMEIREIVNERKYSENRKPLLAFGGAVYDEVTYDVDMVENKAQLAFLRRNIYADLENKRSVRNAYGALGIGPWDNLPGTLSEVNNIKGVVKKADVLTGRDVTERKIKEFSEDGTLSKYKVLHFATHGLVEPEVPELSAVVLSQFEKEQGREDGYLCMGEIAKLVIKADFVNLSACETGLGKIYGGEGVVGLTQSFLLAGANAVSVSLWEVSDESTSQFMVSMYDKVQSEGVDYADAMTEIKRQFISGDFGDKYKSPYFWAPFVYYGKDGLKNKLK